VSALFEPKELLTMIQPRKNVRHVSGLLLAGGAAVLALSGGCSAADSAQCNEFSAGDTSIEALQIDATTREFLLATSDFDSAVSAMETSLYTACKNIDGDLGVTDTWSAKSTLDAQVNEACTQASTKIQAVLAAGGTVQASCTLGITPGHCNVSVDVEANCEAQCTGSASCTPPDIRVACQPGDLSVVCDGTCMASATCEGTVTAAATCQGSCSASCSGSCNVTATQPTVHCEGTCAGNCTGTCNGSTVSGAACAGTCSGRCDAMCTYTGGVSAHCDGSCSGTCTGDCKIDAMANVMCGANVRCKGGCSTMGTLPQCESDVTPPMCNVDAKCQASCQGRAEAQASCTPPAATFDCGASASGDLQKLATTLQTNLPAILGVLEQAPLALEAAAHVVTTGADVVSAAGSLGAKSLVCATTAASAGLSAQASLTVSVSASASVSTSCGGPGAS
jgi:hypothetical protein